MENVRQVTSHVDIGRAGPAQLVDQDPVLLRHRDGRAVGLDADARHGEITGDTPAGGGHDRLQAFGALEGGDLVSGQQLDAVRAVNRAHDPADLAAQDPLQRGLTRKGHGHPDPELGQ
jgi:hypothetical protein